MADHPRIVINGQAGTGISPLDRGMVYGDGVFRTARVVAGQVRWWSDHMEKLGDDAARLGIPFPGEDMWRADLVALGVLPQAGVLRLTLSRGEGPRGYAPPKLPRPTRILACWPDELPAYPEAGLNLRAGTLRLASQPALAGVKHLNRLENVLARAEWDDPEIHESVLMDTKDRVVSGVMSNLFVWREGRLLTPRLDQCGVSGVARARLIARARSANIPVEEADFGLDGLLAAEAVLLTNSLMGLRRAARLGERVWPETPIYPRLAALLDD